MAITLNVKDTAGANIPDVPLGGAVAIEALKAVPRWTTMTDAAGNASLSAPIHNLETALGFALSGRVDPQNPRAAAIATHTEHMFALTRRFAFLDVYRVAIVGARPTATAEVVVHPAVKLTVPFTVDGNPGSQKGALAQAIGYFDRETTTDNVPSLSIYAPQNQAFELSVLVGNKISFLPMAAYSADGTSSAIGITTTGATVNVDAHLVRPVGVASATEETKAIPGITLLKVDGSVAYLFMRGDVVGVSGPEARGKFVGSRNAAGEVVMKVEPGEYWVLPTFWINMIDGYTFREAIKKGHTFSTSGLPKVTAVNGQTLSITVDGDDLVRKFADAANPLIRQMLPIVGPNPPVVPAP